MVTDPLKNFVAVTWHLMIQQEKVWNGELFSVSILPLSLKILDCFFGIIDDSKRVNETCLVQIKDNEERWGLLPGKQVVTPRCVRYIWIIAEKALKERRLLN